MPRELVAVAPRTPQLREYEELPLGPRQVRIGTELASPKHGTELVAYRDDPVATRRYDPTWGAVLPLSPKELSKRFPLLLGNMAVGTVEEIGSDVSRFRPGDRVFGHFPIRETQTVNEDLPDLLLHGLTAEAALCLDPAVMALAIRDGGLKLGDRAAVFGLGAIGLIAVQLAKLAGAEVVFGVDPLLNRRELARRFGADEVLDPGGDHGDIGLALRRLAGKLPGAGIERPGRPVVGGYLERDTELSQAGVDVAIETSGSAHALHQAIRGTRFGGTVCVLSYYGGEGSGLRLGEEFHINRIQLVSARSESQPMRDAPGWSLERIVELGLSWLRSGRIQTKGIIDPIVSFEDSTDAFRMIDEHPDRAIKLGVRFP